MQLSESQVTGSKLADLFNGAFMEVTHLDGSELKVRPERVQVNVRVVDDQKKIIFTLYQALKDISLTQAALIVNKLNNELSFVRMYVVDYNGEIIFVADYTMNYERGVLAYHIVDNIKWFEKITIHAVIEYFQGKIA